MTIDQTKPFGMATEILPGRDQLIKGMHKSLVLEMSASGFRGRRRVPIDEVAGHPILIKGIRPADITPLKGWSSFHGQGRDLQGWSMGNRTGPRRPPAKTTLILQKPVNGIERPTGAPPTE